jgi:DNA-binding response OmpR family regulator
MENTGTSCKLKVLYGEGDPEILAAQAVTLKKAGHQVETAVGRKAVEEGFRKGSFDLVVLGPTLTRNDRHHLPYIIKKANAGARVLVMHTDGERHPYVDGNIDTGRSIDDLIAKIAAMWSSAPASQPARAKSAAATK